MVPERDLDPAALYEVERRAFLDSLGALPAQSLATVVPATPAWTVRDVLAHLVGITADLNAQRFGSGDGDAWTASQVAGRAGRSVDDLAAEWDREAPTFEHGLRLFGYFLGAHYLGDLLHHVGDVRVALAQPPARDDEAIAVGLDFYLESFEETLTQTGLGAVDVEAGNERWRLGAGDPIASVGATRYEMFRALGGRRTLPELRQRLNWSGDVDAVIAVVSRYPTPEQPVLEE